MPYAKHIKITAICDVLVSGVPTEIAQYGVSVINGFLDVNTANPSGDDKNLMDDTANDFRTFHTSLAAAIAPQVVLREVKFATIVPPPPGSLAQGVYATDPYIAPILNGAGTGAGARHAAQTACVVSLRTARRGPTGRGRFYVPGVTMQVGDNWAWGAGELPGFRAAAQTLLNNINNAPQLDSVDVNFKVVVASTKGYNTEVNGVQVGSLPDTQRRRRNGLEEAYNAPLAVG